MGDGSYLRFKQDFLDREHEQSLKNIRSNTMPDMSYDDKTLQSAALAKTRNDYYLEEYARTKQMFEAEADTPEFHQEFRCTPFISEKEIARINHVRRKDRCYQLTFGRRAGKTQEAVKAMIETLDKRFFNALIGHLFINECKVCGRQFIDYKHDKIDECVDCRH